MKPVVSFLLILFHISNAQTAVIDEVQETQNYNGKLTNPFLSTTLSTTITSLSNDLNLDSARKSLFSETLTHFLTKIFQDQQVYDVKIISVHLFDDHIIEGHYEEVPQRNSHVRNSGETRHALSFSTVISAEYTKEDQINSIANDNFRKMLIHVCDKFQNHLIQFMKDTGDAYFMDVERVTLGDFERIHGAEGSGRTAASVKEDSANNDVWGLSSETVNMASIIAIVVSGIAFLVLAFASVKLYREEKQLLATRWRSEEIESSTKSTRSSHPGALHNSHPVAVVDDYTFNPLGSGNSYNANTPPYTSYRDDPINNNPRINEEEITFSSVWPESSPPTLFPVKEAAVAAATVAAAAPKKLSYSEELQKLPKQHVFAPPGKIGVAIDVYNGQPVVHKVRKNSPLENMLQPNDIIMAIDDENASCLSAADVTSMMVKRMDKVRKITYVRPG
eukprot:CAMPEP_0172537306 /NCGR_PEP_ID=MMETSP1067-20121228/8931_1 /TAXON_ID=265564 ORGANISM="Thalassiosira punctigera, Strain Tpunct2005C2" /NCGR_SAMPLE_ID=MMETSP1067 /ASSEMBLY_ACC=CAM_ASM_000444 /LENGTH=447 /DNA_ID=CAMNT_0013322579 /DNA_START=148 /DNA_END=1491 /DNA_ORIENTATION=+